MDERREVSAGLWALALLRFAAELGLLVAFGYAGWRLGVEEHALLGAVLAVALPVLAIAVWARWVAPRAAHRLADPARLAVEVTLFAIALVAVIDAGPGPGSAVAGVLLWLAFLVSVPARRLPVPAPRDGVPARR